MTTKNTTEEVSDAVAIAVGILTSSTPNFVVPVDTATISASAGSTLVSSEGSISQPSTYSFPSPNVLVLTTFSTTTIPYGNPTVPVTAGSLAPATTDPIIPVSVSTSLPYDISTVFVAPSSTIHIAPLSTISPPTTISSTSPLLPISSIPTTISTPLPLAIIPTTLTSLSSSPSSTQVPLTNDPAAGTSTTPRPTTSSHSSSSHVGVYVGAAVGGAILFLLLLIAIICLSRRRRRKHPKHHPDRPAFIGGYELKLDKVGELQRVVHEKRVRRHTFEAWKRGVVPDIDPDDVAGKSEFNVTSGSPPAGDSNSLVDVAEDVPNENYEAGGLIGDDDADYVVSPIEEEQKTERPISGITPLIFQWEQRASQKGKPATGMIGQAL
ncbi:hypothetical protein SBOR_1110 [Sclerotinia borealis F-4128]|uniref:Uncharacterized protein n=1 Tax=Sclerotinia borealis (strain F-4128) TaxID=1432307 RepID=W9CQV2_SCLBF|nr:hypothetical protein SBOR_1110 [Sclerotinia borealis F-4128]